MKNRYTIVYWCGAIIQRDTLNFIYYHLQASGVIKDIYDKKKTYQFTHEDFMKERGPIN